MYACDKQIKKYFFAENLCVCDTKKKKIYSSSGKRTRDARGKTGDRKQLSQQGGFVKFGLGGKKKKKKKKK